VIGLAIASALACESTDRSLLEAELPQQGAPPPGAIACATVAAKVRASYTDDQRAMFAREPKMSRWFDTTMKILEQSCEQDRWPEAVKQCAVDARPNDPTSMTACNQTMPPDLQNKLQGRLVEAMKKLE
jgi:hypothetical protein